MGWSSFRGAQGGGAYLFLLFVISLISMWLCGSAYIDSIGGRRDRERELIFIGGEFERAFLSYRNVSTALGDDINPRQISDLLEDRRGGRVIRHLRKVYFDPLTGSCQWGEVRAGGRLIGVYSLAGGTPFLRRKEASSVGADELRPERYSDWVFGIGPVRF